MSKCKDCDYEDCACGPIHTKHESMQLIARAEQVEEQNRHLSEEARVYRKGYEELEAERDELKAEVERLEDICDRINRHGTTMVEIVDIAKYFEGKAQQEAGDE